MSIPLDLLYHFLRDFSNVSNTLIYRYYPHGSKKHTDCMAIEPYSAFENASSMHAFFHDQEPLNFQMFPKPNFWHMDGQIVYQDPQAPCSFYKTSYGVSHSIYTDCVLVHSEKRSDQVKLFEQIKHHPAYWWNHALVALDWYRYAQHDLSLKFSPSIIDKDFLVYNRAWSGTREYRLKFAELIVEHNLVSQCQMKFNPQDAHREYMTYKFINPAFQIQTQLENYFERNTATSDASASYNCLDYNRCGIEVVLETLFDDHRLHLTEKSLRPIACGKPFILCGTQGSLQYLRDYGFKTFSPWIDEWYDEIDDPLQRLTAVVAEMQKISQLPREQKHLLWKELDQVAKYNQKRFFSKDFFDHITDEFKENFAKAVAEAKKSCNDVYYRQWLQMHCNLGNVPLNSRELEQIEFILAQHRSCHTTVPSQA